MWTFEVAPAHVKAYALLRYTLQGEIQRLQAQAQMASIRRPGHVPQLTIAHHRRVRRIDLEDQASVDDGAVLVAEHHGQGMQVLFVRMVVRRGYREQHLTWTDRRHECLDHAEVSDGFFEIGDVSLQFGAVLPGDGSDVERRRPARRRKRRLAAHRGCVLRKGLRWRGVRVWIDRLETAEPVTDVVRKAIFAKLSVGDDVDANRRLLLDRAANRALEPCVKVLVVVRLILVAREQQLAQVIWSRQAANVGGEQALGAAVHAYDNRTMKVVLIAPVSEAERARISAVDTRLDVQDAWELFGPELVADWPVHTAEWYLPKRFQSLQDSDDSRAHRDKLLASAEVVCITFPPPHRIAGRAPNLRFVHQLPAGVSNLSRGDLWRIGVPVTSGRGAGSTVPIAEWAIAATLALLKDLPRAAKQRIDGELDRHAFRGRQVAGKTLGVVGLGGIGREVARLGRALGMRAVGTRRSEEPVEHVDRLFRP